MSGCREEFYRVTSLAALDAAQANPRYLRTEFYNQRTGEWDRHYPLSNPHTRRGLAGDGEAAPMRVVYRAKMKH